MTAPSRSKLCEQEKEAASVFCYGPFAPIESLKVSIGEHRRCGDIRVDRACLQVGQAVITPWASSGHVTTRSYANLRYQEALDWRRRKWTKGGCSVLLLFAQF